MRAEAKLSVLLLYCALVLVAAAQFASRTRHDGLLSAGVLAIDQPSSNVHYVGVAGKDDDGGSLSHPWATMQHADSVAKPGDTVVVLDGTYRGDIALATSGTPGQRILYKAQNKWKAKLVGTGSGAGSAVVGLSGGYVTLQGFDITGTDANGIILAVYGAIANHNQAVANYVHDLVVPCNSDSGTAIETGGGDNYNGIRHNDMIENLVVNIRPKGGCISGHQASGLFAETPDSVVAMNTVINAGYAIQSWHAASNLLVYCNTLVNNLRAITVGAGDAPYNRTNDYTIVQGNVIYNSTEFAVAETGHTGPHNVYRDNVIYGGSKRISLSNELQATGSVFANPRFVNNTGTASGNYRFRVSSPVRRERLARLWTPTALSAAIIAASSKEKNAEEPARPTAGIHANATRLYRGEQAVLTWKTKNAVSAMINDVSVPLNGSVAVRPEESKVYKLVATSPSGDADWGSVAITILR